MNEGARAKKAESAAAADVVRLLGFSDAFFPIIITLLVIEIHVPEHEHGELGHALLAAWPAYAAFALAFLHVGVIWLNHHGLFQLVRRVDAGLNWRNLGILGTSALIPFPTRVLAEALQSGDPMDLRAAVVLYSLVAALMSFAWYPVFRHLERCQADLAPEAPAGYFSDQSHRPWIGVGAYIVAALAGWFISPWIALGVFLLMMTFHAKTSDGVIGRRLKRAKA